LSQQATAVVCSGVRVHNKRTSKTESGCFFIRKMAKMQMSCIYFSLNYLHIGLPKGGKNLEKRSFWWIQEKIEYHSKMFHFDAKRNLTTTVHSLSSP